MEPVAAFIKDPIPLAALEPDASVGSIPAKSEDAAVPAYQPQASPGDFEDSPWPTEGAEAAAISDAQSRGETMIAAALTSEVEDEPEKKSLPSLDQMLQRVPANVRETLDELFRAKWTRVIRVRQKDLA